VGEEQHWADYDAVDSRPRKRKRDLMEHAGKGGTLWTSLCARTKVVTRQKKSDDGPGVGCQNRQRKKKKVSGRSDESAHKGRSRVYHTVGLGIEKVWVEKKFGARDAATLRSNTGTEVRGEKKGGQKGPLKTFAKNDWGGGNSEKLSRAGTKKRGTHVKDGEGKRGETASAETSCNLAFIER